MPGDWPLDAATRPRSERELMAASEDALSDWLQASARSWALAPAPADRVKAFSPLTFSANEKADMQLWTHFARAPVDFLDRFEEAVARSLETVSPSMAMPVATLLLRIGARLGCKRPQPALNLLLAKSHVGAPAVRAAYADAIAFFTLNRLRPQEARTVVYMLRDMRLLTGKVAVELITASAVEYSDTVREDIELLAGFLIHDEGDQVEVAEATALRRFFANELVNRLKAAQAYRLVLRAHEHGMPELRTAIEAYRLELKDTKHPNPARRMLRDRLTDSWTAVDLSDFDQNLVSVFGAMDAIDKAFAADPMREALGLEDLELGGE